MSSQNSAAATRVKQQRASFSMKSANEIEEHVSRLPAGRLIDMHFDLPLALFWNQTRKNVIATDFLPEFEAGDIGLLGVATYVEDKHLSDPLRVARDQVARVYAELETNPRLVLCKSFADIQRAQNEGQIGLMFT